MTTNKAVLAYANQIRAADLTTGTGTWDPARPLDNLELPQLPVPYVLATPDAGALSITWAPAAATTVDVLAVLGHTLPAGAVVTFTDEEANQLAQVTWNPGANDDLAPNVVVVLASPAEVESITVTITSAGSAPVRLAGLWASVSFRACSERGWGFAPDDFSLFDQVDATRWVNPRTVANGTTGAFPDLTEDQAIGSAGSVNLRAVFRQLGTSRPALWVPRAESQASINRSHVYGFFETPGRTQQRGGPWWRADFSIREMR